MWKTVSARVTGSAHATLGTRCQDACRVSSIRDHIAALAVADGAGSASHSHLGAKAAVIAAIRSLERSAPADTSDSLTLQAALERSIDAARERLLHLSLIHGVPKQAFATTLQVALVGPHGIAYARVGDGCGVAEVDGTLALVGPPPHNEFVNETTFLTSEPAPPDLTVVNGAVTAVAVFTDGLQALGLRLTDWSPHEPFFKPLFAFVRAGVDTRRANSSLSNFLKSEPVVRRSDDDRALVLVVKASA